jgi:hypothetical protein
MRSIPVRYTLSFLSLLIATAHSRLLEMSYHYDDYVWTQYDFPNRVRYNPPSDPSFYNTTSHDRTSNDDLTDTAQLIEQVLEEWREWDTVDSHEVIEGQKPRHDQLKHLVQHIVAILEWRTEQDVEMKPW